MEIRGNPGAACEWHGAPFGDGRGEGERCLLEGDAKFARSGEAQPGGMGEPACVPRTVGGANTAATSGGTLYTEALPERRGHTVVNLLLRRCQAGDVGGKTEKVRGARRDELTQSETQANASTTTCSGGDAFHGDNLKMTCFHQCDVLRKTSPTHTRLCDSVSLVLASAGRKRNHAQFTCNNFKGALEASDFGLARLCHLGRKSDGVLVAVRPTESRAADLQARASSANCRLVLSNFSFLPCQHTQNWQKSKWSRHLHHTNPLFNNPPCLHRSNVV